MKIEQLSKVSFQEKDKLPCTSGVYIALDAEMTPLYVGMSRNLKQRLSGHQRLKQFKSMNCIAIAWIEVPETDIVSLEKQLIDELSPKLNRRLFPKRNEKDMALELDPKTIRQIAKLSQNSGETMSEIASRVLEKELQRIIDMQLKLTGVFGC